MANFATKKLSELINTICNTKDPAKLIHSYSDLKAFLFNKQVVLPLSAVYFVLSRLANEKQHKQAAKLQQQYLTFLTKNCSILHSGFVNELCYMLDLHAKLRFNHSQKTKDLREMKEQIFTFYENILHENYQQAKKHLEEFLNSTSSSTAVTQHDYEEQKKYLRDLCQNKKSKSSRTTQLGFTTAAIVSGLAMVVTPTVATQHKRAIGAEFLVYNDTTASQIDPSITALTNGNIVIVWEDFIVKELMARIYSSSGDLVKTTFSINSNTAGDQQYPTVLALSNGGFVVVWSKYNLSNYNIYMRVFDANGNGTISDTLVPATSSNEDVIPSVAQLNNNNLVVSWHKFPSFKVFFQIITTGGVRVGGTVAPNVTDPIQLNTKVISTVDGFLIVWNGGVSSPPPYARIKGQFFNQSGTSLTQEFTISTTTTVDQRLPVACSLGNATYAIGWKSELAPSQMCLQRINSNGTKLGSQTIVSPSGSAQLNVKLITVDNGNFVAVFQSAEQPNGQGVFFQIFNNTGVSIGPTFPIHDTVTNNQQTPTVVNLGNETFAVTWASDQQIQNNFAIYAKIIDYSSVVALTTQSVTTIDMTTQFATTDSMTTEALTSGPATTADATTASTATVATTGTTASLMSDGTTGTTASLVTIGTTGTDITTAPPSFATTEQQTTAAQGSTSATTASLVTTGTTGIVVTTITIPVNQTTMTTNQNTTTEPLTTGSTQIATSQFSSSSTFWNASTTDFPATSNSLSPGANTSSSSGTPEIGLVLAAIAAGVFGLGFCVVLAAVLIRRHQRRKSESHAINSAEIIMEDFPSYTESVSSFQPHDSQAYATLAIDSDNMLTIQVFEIIGQSGEKYEKLEKVNRALAIKIFEDTGYEILFKENIKSVSLDLGHGNYGDLFLVQNKKTKQIYAAKIVKGKKYTHIQDEQTEDKFEESENEIEALKKLNLVKNKNIVELYDYSIVTDEIPPVLTIIMKFAAFGNGNTLIHLLKKLENDSELVHALVIHVARELVNGMLEIHRKIQEKPHVYHNDFKAANYVIHLTENCRIDIIDFGCASYDRYTVPNKGDFSCYDWARLQAHRKAIGTDAAETEVDNSKSDAWSLGLVLLQLALLEKNPLFRAKTAEEYLKRSYESYRNKIQAGLAKLSECGYPEIFVKLVSGLLEVDAKNRLALDDTDKLVEQFFSATHKMSLSGEELREKLHSLNSTSIPKKPHKRKEQKNPENIVKKYPESQSVSYPQRFSTNNNNAEEVTNPNTSQSNFYNIPKPTEPQPPREDIYNNLKDEEDALETRLGR